MNKQLRMYDCHVFVIERVIEEGSQLSRIYASSMIKLGGVKNTICYFIGVALDLSTLFRRGLNGCARLETWVFFP